MQKALLRKSAKKVIHMLTGVVLVLAMTGCGSGGKEEAYRTVQVYKVEGTAEVEREVVGVLEAYENMMLQTKDIVNVSADSNMQVKLDEDKYILLEPNTKIHLEAEGNSVDSKTKIFVETGGIVCNIENPLSENSTYEVNTPNSTMAVRGTTFRVALNFDEEGNSFTDVAVYEGQVASNLIAPDGTVSEESVMVPAGKQVQIKGDDVESVYVFTSQDIPYQELKSETLNFLNEIMEKGTELSVTKEEITQIIETLEEEEALNTEGTEDTQKAESEEQTEPGETAESEEAEPESEKKEENSEQKNSETADSSESDNNNESTGGGYWGGGSTGGSTGGGSTSGGGSSGGSTVVPTYTVTFMYGDTVFGTQTVTQGKCATEPILFPDVWGGWDFDFTQTITSDVTVEWVDNDGTE